MMYFIETLTELFVEGVFTILALPVWISVYNTEELLYCLESIKDYGIDFFSVVGILLSGSFILISIAAIVFYIWIVYKSTKKIFEVCTTTKITENVIGVVTDKDRSTSGGNWISNGTGMRYIPEVTEYYVYVNYKNYSGSILSSYLYDRVSIGDSINLKLIRRVSRINGKETSFKLK